MRVLRKLFVGSLLLGMGLAALSLSGCTGNDGANGLPGTPAPVLETLNVESCVVCHADSGTLHQEGFAATKDTTFAATIDSVTSVAGATAGTFDVTMLFTITNNGLPYIDVDGLPGLDQKRFYAGLYDSTTRKVDPTFSLGTPVATATPGQYSVTATGAAFAPDAADTNAYAYMYITQGAIPGTHFGHIQLYDDVVNVGLALPAIAPADAVDYASVASVSACEECHGAPYGKHGYRQATVAGLPDFVSCKSCHYDSRPGSDGAEFFGDDTYAYTANVMTDVHASHLNVFPYPQAMNNCITCHTGTKLDDTLTDANFRRAVCETCHADVDPATNTVVALPLSVIIPTWHDPDTMGECNTCHFTGGSAPVFSTIHVGFDQTKYDTAVNAEAGDLQYTYSIDNIVYDDVASSLTITWGAKDAAGTALDVLNLDPAAGPVFLGDPADRNNESEGNRILVGYYGWGTNNVANYDQYKKADILANTTYDAATGLATTIFPLSDKLTTYAATKLEVGIIGVPLVGNPGVMAAVDSVTEGIILATGVLEDRDTAVGVVANAKCDACHDSIVIHTNSSYGHTAVGNVNACIFCHNTSSAAHVDQQGRSIDSYLHSIHTFQTEPEFIFPMFTTTACEACHTAGNYDAPSQADWSGSSINSGSSDPVTVGPASRACGSCHRAQAIKDADTDKLDGVNGHTQTNGYRVPASVSPFVDVMNQIFSLLK